MKDAFLARPLKAEGCRQRRRRRRCRRRRCAPSPFNRPFLFLV